MTTNQDVTSIFERMPLSFRELTFCSYMRKVYRCTFEHLDGVVAWNLMVIQFTIIDHPNLKFISGSIPSNSVAAPDTISRYIDNHPMKIWTMKWSWCLNGLPDFAIFFQSVQCYLPQDGAFSGREIRVQHYQGIDRIVLSCPINHTRPMGDLPRCQIVA